MLLAYQIMQMSVVKRKCLSCVHYFMTAASYNKLANRHKIFFSWCCGSLFYSLGVRFLRIMVVKYIHFPW